jgi:deazaflavin-dependent oxidoreductase (nitroreductase family)
MDSAQLKALGTSEPLPPSAVVRIVLRPMTKVLNPLMLRLAGRRHFRMAAQLRHVGRRSGRPYVTAVGARRTDDVIVIPLTFGNRSDWSQNVRAAGGCFIRLAGQDYMAVRPELRTMREARPLILAAFSALERAALRVLGIRQVLCLQITPASGLASGAAQH